MKPVAAAGGGVWFRQHPDLHRCFHPIYGDALPLTHFFPILVVAQKDDVDKGAWTGTFSQKGGIWPQCWYVVLQRIDAVCDF